MSTGRGGGLRVDTRMMPVERRVTAGSSKGTYNQTACPSTSVLR